VGRPSVADARRRQILEAAIRCLSNRGLAASTLDGIAAEAGMARGHVRHFVGNRDEILTAAAVLFYFGEVPDLDGETTGAHGGSFLPTGTTTVAEALDYLFGAFADPGPENLAALAFVDAARTNERIRRRRLPQLRG
jgi:TetR/AcrR family transcriptional repressor of bet genes